MGGGTLQRRAMPTTMSACQSFKLRATPPFTRSLPLSPSLNLSLSLSLSPRSGGNAAGRAKPLWCRVRTCRCCAVRGGKAWPSHRRGGCDERLRLHGQAEDEDKPASTAVLILVHTAAGTDNKMTVGASAQTITGFKAPPPGITKAPPTAPPPAKPCPPQPSTFGVGAKASAGGLNEATSRTVFLSSNLGPGLLASKLFSDFRFLP